MHISSYEGGTAFHYNGDYSGDILITKLDGTEKTTSLKELAKITYNSEITLWEGFEAAPIRHFVADVGISTGISRLEQMETEEALKEMFVFASVITRIDDSMS